jgi:hypothetical protein
MNLELWRCMADAGAYYADLVSKGYPADHALAYTRQYFPEFTPVTVAPSEALAPVQAEAVPVAPSPVSAAEVQPMMTADATVAMQPAPAVAVDPTMAAVPQPMMAQPMPTVPQPMMGADPAMAAVPMQPMMGQPMPGMGAMLPTGTTSAAASGPLSMAVLATIGLALVLALAAQFNGAWLAGEAEEGTHITSGLHSITFDCSGISDDANQSFCISTYAYLTTPMGDAPPENSTDMVHKGTQEGVCERVEELAVTMATAFSGGDQGVIDAAESAAAEAKAECLLSDEAGTKGGTWLWLGTVVALLSAVVMVLPKVGVDALPSAVSSNARWASMFAGVLMVLAVLVWRGALPDDPDSVMGASMGVYLAVVAGILAILSGVLDLVNGRSGAA